MSAEHSCFSYWRCHRSWTIYLTLYCSYLFVSMSQKPPYRTHWSCDCNKHSSKKADGKPLEAEGCLLFVGRRGTEFPLPPLFLLCRCHHWQFLVLKFLKIKNWFPRTSSIAMRSGEFWFKTMVTKQRWKINVMGHIHPPGCFKLKWELIPFSPWK